MNQTFCSAALVGERVRCEGRVLRYGRSLGFTEVKLYVDGGGGGGGAPPSPRLVAVGRHTKAFSRSVQDGGIRTGLRRDPT